MDLQKFVEIDKNVAYVGKAIKSKIDYGEYDSLLDLHDPNFNFITLVRPTHMPKRGILEQMSDRASQKGRDFFRDNGYYPIEIIATADILGNTKTKVICNCG